MSEEVQFNKEVARATFNEKTRTDRCLKSMSKATLVDEEEIASRSSEFQNVSRIGKRKLHDHHLQRKRCRLLMRQDITDAFWSTYEEAAWQRRVGLVTESDYKAVVRDAIKSVDKENIIADPAR